MGCSSSSEVKVPEMDAGARLHAQASGEAVNFELNQTAAVASADARREAEKQAELDRLEGAGGSWTAQGAKGCKGSSTAARSQLEEDKHKAAMAIQGAQRQKQARHKANGKRVQKDKKKAQEKAEAEARLRMNQGDAAAAYGKEHGEAATTIQSAQRTKMARQKVNKKRNDKSDIGGVGGLL
jgi:hypothetical protein